MRATLRRFVRHTLFSLFGTATDTLVLWICSTYILNGTYVGETIISPVISFECGNIVNFLVSSRFVWKDRLAAVGFRNKIRKFIGFNLSYSTVLLIKTTILIAIERWLGWDVVICNIMALTLAGIINFLMNDKVIFKNKKNKISDNEQAIG